jgi:hypothetical protein
MAMATDLKAIADDVLQRLTDAGPQANRAGISVFLERYIDSAEALALQCEIDSRAATKYEVRHRPGERRIWVRAR